MKCVDDGIFIPPPNNISINVETNQFNQSPVYKKALDIFQVSRGIAFSVSEKRHVLEMGYSGEENDQAAGSLVSTSLKLFPELAAIHNATNRENILKRAQRIRVSARQLLAKCRIIEKQGLREKEFLNLLRKEISHFDHLFGEWLKTIQVGKQGN